MRRKTTNTEVRWEHAKQLLPRGRTTHPGATAWSILAGQEGGDAAAGTGAGRPPASSPLPVNPNDLLTAALKDTSQQLDQWRTTTQAQAEAVAQNTLALQQSTATRGNGSSAGNILNTAASFLGGGLGALPLVSGLLGLFGGGHKTVPPLTKYLAPPSLTIQNGVDAAGQAGAVAYDQFGNPRTTGGGAAAPPSNVTVHVQAMDSRSFLDHSVEIAQAVRQAMLNLHSINDVVNDL